MTKKPRADKAIERLAPKCLPPGGQTVLVRINDGPPQRGLLYRANAPFSPLVHELKSPDGGTFKIQVSCFRRLCARDLEAAQLMLRRPDPPPAAVRARRAAGRKRWHRWAALRRAGRALAPVQYGSVGLAKLIVAGWLPRRESDLYRPEDVARAIDDLLEH